MEHYGAVQNIVDFKYHVLMWNKMTKARLRVKSRCEQSVGREPEGWGEWVNEGNWYCAIFHCL